MAPIACADRTPGHPKKPSTPMVVSYPRRGLRALLTNIVQPRKLVSQLSQAARTSRKSFLPQQWPRRQRQWRQRMTHRDQHAKRLTRWSTYVTCLNFLQGVQESLTALTAHTCHYRPRGWSSWCGPSPGGASEWQRDQTFPLHDQSGLLSRAEIAPDLGGVGKSVCDIL